MFTILAIQQLIIPPYLLTITIVMVHLYFYLPILYHFTLGLWKLTRIRNRRIYLFQYHIVHVIDLRLNRYPKIFIDIEQVHLTDLNDLVDRLLVNVLYFNHY